MTILVFDMDGVTVDLYGVANWLELLRAEQISPYQEAKPLVDMKELRQVLLNLKTKDYKVVITSWLSKGASKAYKAAIKQAKKEWLDRYQFPYDELHFQAYGQTKANATRKKYKECEQILIDDNPKIRGGWTLGATIDGTQDFIAILKTFQDKIVLSVYITFQNDIDRYK